MKQKPSDDVSTAILDAVLEVSEDGSAVREELQSAAVRREVFANVALDRWIQDHPDNGPLGEGERFNAIEETLVTLASEAVEWLLEEGYLALEGDRVRLGLRQFRLGRQPYIPGTHREEDLYGSVRSVTPFRKKLIEESIASLGDLREFFPVLEDEDGNVVDGRHRRAIDPTWPAARVVVPRERRLAVALAANRGNSWTQEDWKRLRIHQHFISGAQATSRALATLALQENADRSDAEIARLTGASRTTVASARKGANLAPFSGAKSGRPAGSQDTKPRQRTVSKDEVDRQAWPLFAEGQSRQQVAQSTGLGDKQAQLSQERYEQDQRTREQVEHQPAEHAPDVLPDDEIGAGDFVVEDFLEQPETEPECAHEWVCSKCGTPQG